MIHRFLKFHRAMIQRKVGIIQSVKSTYVSNFPTTVPTHIHLHNTYIIPTQLAIILLSLLGFLKALLNLFTGKRDEEEI